jgi:hypothetical protein
MQRRLGRRKRDVDASDAELCAQPVADGPQTEMQPMIKEGRMRPTKGRHDAKQASMLYHTARLATLAAEIAT